MVILVIKLFGSVVCTLVLVFHMIGLKEFDHKLWAPLVTLFVLNLTMIDKIIKHVRSSREDKASRVRESKRSMEKLRVDFRLNYHAALVKLGIAKNQSEKYSVSFDLIYKWSQDDEIIALLFKENYAQIAHALQDFARLYKPE